MAQTENGEKIFQHYCDVDTLTFASDWMDFFLDNGMTNQIWDWHKWCDEFAEWVILSTPYRFDEGAYGLIVEKENA
jgi:hypothetical protein